jgi:hypothetical protein
MRKLMGLICIGLMTLPAICQSASKYEVATIMGVEPHQATGDGATHDASYEVSVKVGGTIYVVLYTPPLGDTDAVKYAAGRELLVLVGEKTITYNDILGQSRDVTILRRKPAVQAKQPK